MVEANRSDRKTKQDSKNFLDQSADSFQDNIRRSAPLAAASYMLVGAILLLGGAGYALDRWCGTSPWFFLAGLLIGIIVGFYEFFKAAQQR